MVSLTLDSVLYENDERDEVVDEHAIERDRTPAGDGIGVREPE